MDIEGNLEAISLPTLIQLIIQEGDPALIQLERGTAVGKLYLESSHLCYAELNLANPSDTNAFLGEEAVYELLAWQTGRFKVQKNVFPPAQNIDQSWDHLIMEGLRRVDEKRASSTSEETSAEDTLADLLLNLSDADAAVIREIAAQQKEKIKMGNLNEILDTVMKIDGALAVALVDWESGLTLGTKGNNGFNIDLAAAGNTNVVRSKLSVMRDLKLKGSIEDILITLTEQYHLIRLLDEPGNLFLYVALSRSNSNLGLARHHLATLEKNLSI